MLRLQTTNPIHGTREEGTQNTDIHMAARKQLKLKQPAPPFPAKEMSFEAIVGYARRMTDDGHPTITIADHESKTQGPEN